MKNNNLIDKTKNVPLVYNSSENEEFSSITNMDNLIQRLNQEISLAKSQLAQETIATVINDQFKMLMIENTLNNIAVLTAFEEYVTHSFSDSISKCKQFVDAYIESTCEQIRLWESKQK